MSTYVLVSLWSNEDEASVAAYAMARRLNEVLPALGHLEGEAPDREEVRSALSSSDDAALVIFGHGGTALSARADGPSWVRPSELAEIAPGRRVYAFACDTLTPPWRTFGEAAVEACVKVFVGHAGSVTSPLIYEESEARRQIETGILAMITAFVAGENDAAVLRNSGETEASDKALGIELDLPSQDPERTGAFGWSSMLFLHRFFERLDSRSK